MLHAYRALDPASAGGTWLVVNTHPHREATAVTHLLRQGFDPYCPMISKRIRHARGSETVRRPLFPGYAFVRRPAPCQSWRPILSTIGVRSLVGTPEPGTVDQGLIDALKAREAGGPASPAAFALGQSVIVRSGALDGFVARVCELRERDRIVVLLDLLHRKVRLDIQAGSLEPA